VLIIDTWGNLPFVAMIYPLMLGGRQTFLVTVEAIQFIFYEQVLWGQMAAATIVAALPQLLLSLMVQKYIVRGLTMGAVKCVQPLGLVEQRREPLFDAVGDVERQRLDRRRGVDAA
jgi:hypothetical protein